jgi:hypothetical protein
MPSEFEWAWMYCYEVALTDLLEKEVIYLIKQLNTDGDKKIYEPLTRISLDVNSPWYGVKHCVYDFHMIDKLFKTKVSVNYKNKAFVEYAKRWVKTWCNILENEVEYKHSYLQFLSFIDSDLAKEGLGNAHAQILEGYLVE